MGFTCGIVGLPNVGKSTIFNALTAQSVEASNYPFCTIDPNHGIVPIIDDRLEQVGSLIGSGKITPTTLEFLDIAGLVPGASKGEGLGNQFLSHIQSVDAIAHVVRCFEDANVAHVDEHRDAVSDAELVNTELILKDLEVVERQMDKGARALRLGEKEEKKKLAALEKAKDGLTRGLLLRNLELDAEEQLLLRPFNLLTAKPMLLLANTGDEQIGHKECLLPLHAFAEQISARCVDVCGQTQAEIAELDPDSRQEFLEELGLDDTALDEVLKAGYDILNLITFFTANENEARAWTLLRGNTAVNAAERVHTDFAEGFIKAEVIKVPDLIEYGSEAALRERGLVAVHGREYVVEDGDLIFFRARA